MLMFTRTHARLAASDAKKIGEQARLIAKLTTQNSELKTRNVDLWATKDDAVERAEKVFAANLKLVADLAKADANLQAAAWEWYDADKRVTELEARLSPFTTLPPRGAGGRLVSGKQEQAA